MKKILTIAFISLLSLTALTACNSSIDPADKEEISDEEQRKIQEIIDNDQAKQDEIEAPAVDGNACIYKDVVYETGEEYFDGCNWHTCQDDGSFIGTEIGCEGTGAEPIYKE